MPLPKRGVTAIIERRKDGREGYGGMKIILTDMKREREKDRRSKNEGDVIYFLKR